MPDKYLVLHNNVDDYKAGDVLDGDDLKERKIDIDRLLRLGAITLLLDGMDASGNRSVALSDARPRRQDQAGFPLDPGQSLDPTVTRPTASEIEAKLAGTDEEREQAAAERAEQGEAYQKQRNDEAKAFQGEDRDARREAQRDRAENKPGQDQGGRPSQLPSQPGRPGPLPGTKPDNSLPDNSPDRPDNTLPGQPDRPDRPGQPTQLPSEPSEPTASPLDRMTVGNLVEVATQYGIEGAAQMKKAELIAAIQKAQNEA